MLLTEYATNKSAQHYLKARCNYHAFTMNLHTSDVLSLAHERIANQIAAGKELNDERHFKNTLKVIAFNAAMDLKDKLFNRMEKKEDPALLPEPAIENRDGYEAKDLLRIIDAAIRKKFAHRLKLLEVYDCCILSGQKIEDAAKALQLPLGTVKTNMRMVRCFAKEELLRLN